MRRTDLTGSKHQRRNNMKPINLIRSVLIAFLFSSAAHASGAEVKVFAAASLADSLNEIALKYQAHGGSKVSFNFGGSGLLERQIEAGAPADIFFSADEEKMDALEKKELVARGTRKSLLSNSLVIVVAMEQGAAVKGPQDLAGPAVQRLALGDPRTAPIGIYAKH